MSATELAGEVVLRSQRKMRRALARATDKPGATYTTDLELVRALDGREISGVAEAIRNGKRPHLTPGLANPAATANAIRKNFPTAAARTIADADEILEHKLTIFGRSCELGPHIDWHRDPFSGIRWPGDHFTRIRLIQGGGADIRVLWELNRLQHLPALGRAYALVQDERYAQEFISQLISWSDSNPPRFGPNWTVAMEAGIRAVNIVAALEMFRSSPALNDQVIALILKMLIGHGRFIRANLENTMSGSSNHYLSNLIGLYVIGLTLTQSSRAATWRSFAARALMDEMNRQVLADGVDYEGSVAYHRFVLEIYALFFVTAKEFGIEPSQEQLIRLRRMFEFVRDYLHDDGSAPMIGDSDDGRVIKFKERPASDHSYLLSIAAVMFLDAQFKRSGRIDDEAIWWLGAEALSQFDPLPIAAQASSSSYREAQIFIQRDRSLYLICDCGDHGRRGHGSHAHSDALSIEVAAFGRIFLCDPGTFVYTGSELRRNQFRSTAYHNTVRVDGYDISRITRGELFVLGQNVKPRVSLWETDEIRDVLEAEHDGYRDLDEPVTHRRLITFDKQRAFWIVQDSFTGTGSHDFDLFFNLYPGLEASLGAASRAIIRARDCGLAIVPVSGQGLEAKIKPRHFSSAYGTRMRSSAIMYRLRATVPVGTVMLLIPYPRADEAKVNRIIADFAVR